MTAILVERHESVVAITLNRPDRLNAWDSVMRVELGEIFLAADNADDVRAIVLTGAGERAFSAGQDLAETMAFDSGAEAHSWMDGWTGFYEIIRGLAKPYVAALNGVAAGSAFQVAMMADVRIGHSGVTMGQPEIDSGIPSTLGPWLMIDRIGLSRTIELTLSGRMMDAEECRAIGLIHYIVPAAEVFTKAIDVARILGGKPPGAMRANKKRFNEITEAGFRDALAAGHAIQYAAFASGDPQACMRKFFEVRHATKCA
jgi:enoyl-CoA hydratase/carnithine racemase